MANNLLDPKYDNEKIVVTMDFTASLAAGETLTGTPTTTFETNSGVDSAPGDIANGSSVIAGSQVRVPVKGGIQGNSYRIKTVCSTSNPLKVLEMVAILPIYPL